MAYKKFFVFCLCLLPLAYLVYGAFYQVLGVNPVETIIRTLGDWALYFLLITLSITPLRDVTGWGSLLRFRRMLGLYVFFYACLHGLAFIWFDHGFNVAEIIEDVLKRPFITIGFVSLLLLLPLALTSNNYMIRRLKKGWQRLHKIVYFISILVMVHYFLMIKADYYQPLIFLLCLMCLLGLRLVKIDKEKIMTFVHKLI
ncbi:MAG: sulfoxide reductase heme-binding subunit YedZ [Gammaproteobacteria bacterium]|nr:sulfoxide reductase heme-binding subunit YedZ [Gammaproteobacteria bacterium]